MLVMLIHSGFQMSETAAACPMPVNQIDGADMAFDTRQISSPELKEQTDATHALPRIVVKPVRSTKTTPRDQDRDARVHACSLDIDLIATD